MSNRWNDSDSIFRKHVAIFTNMTSTLVKVKQKRRRITFIKEQDDDSRVTNSQFDERNHLRYYMTRAMRISLGMYVCVGDDVIAW